jgi:hypothetical protein
MLFIQRLCFVWSKPKYDKNLYLLGAGGCGKTHYVLNDYHEILDVLYLSKCYILGNDKSKEFKIRYSVFDVFNKKKPTATYIKNYLNKCNPNIIFLDEYSMADNEYYKNILHCFPYSRIIIANDIDKETGRPYQLSIDCDKYIIPDGFEIKEFNINYRFKDENLLLLCNQVREMIKKKENPLEFIKSKIQKVDNFDYNYKTDYILCSLKNGHEGKDDNFVYQWTSKFEGDKFLVLENKNGYYNGEIVFDDIQVKKEKRHAFTAHGVQGKTIKNAKILIDTRKLFDPNQIYVMISRAERIDQLMIIA